MRKIVAISLIFVFLLTISCFAVVVPTLTVDGQKVNCDVSPQIVNSRLMVPVRAFFESIDGTVGWDAKTKQISITHGNTVIKLTLNSKTAYVNNAKLLLDAAPYVYNDRTLIPARFISEQLGYKITWNDATKTANIVVNGVLNKLYDIRHSIDSTRQRIALDFSNNSVVPEHFMLSDPYRVVLDFYGATSEKYFEEIIGKGKVAKVRVANHDNYVRVVVDLSGQATYKIGNTTNVTYIDFSLDGTSIPTFTPTPTVTLPKRTPLPPNLQMPSKITVVIDPGHGGSDPGAVGYDVNGQIDLREKDVNLSTSLKLEKMLKDKGINVVMTRRTDVYVSLSERAKIANNTNAVMYLSIHNNASTNLDAKGTMTIYGPTKDEQFKDIVSSNDLATNVNNKIGAIGLFKNLGVFEGDEYYVIRNVLAPSIIVEGAFVTNTEDRELLKQDEVVIKIANAIYSGIMKTIDDAR